MPSWRISRQGMSMTAHQAVRKVNWGSRFLNLIAADNPSRARYGQGESNIRPRSKDLAGLKPTGQKNILAFWPKSAKAEAIVLPEMFQREWVLPKEPTKASRIVM